METRTWCKVRHMICFYSIQPNKEACFKITSISNNCVGIVNGYCVIGW